MRRPGFTAAAVLSLGLGTGVNSTVFSLLTTALEPVSHRNPRGWVLIEVNGRRSLPYSDFLTLRDHSRTLADVVLADFTGLSIQAGGQARFVPAAEVSPGFFQAMGAQPVLGRAFAAGERDAAVLAHHFWIRHFAGDPGVIGRQFHSGARVLTVVGVAPPHLRRFLAMQIDAVVPYETPAEGSRRVPVMARLRPGATPLQAEAEVTSLLAPSGTEQRRVTVQRHFTESPLLQAGAVMVQCAVGLVLLIACANVANLLLARHEQGRGELAVRLAMGASRWRLARHQLAGSVALGLLAAPAGLLMAAWSLGALERIPIPSPIPMALDFRLDWRAAAFAAAISILAGVLAGLPPLRQALRSSLAPSLRAAGRTLGFRRFGLGSVLVAGQVAMSLVWLTAGGMFYRSFSNLQDVDPGFKLENRLAAVAIPALNGYTPDRTAAFCRALRPRLEALPGVVSVGMAQSLPLHVLAREEATVQAAGAEERQTVRAGVNRIDPGFLATLEIPLVLGRGFQPSDLDVPRTAIVNEKLAQQLWPGENPVGKTVRTAGAQAREYQVIGAARNSRTRDLTAPPAPFLYLPFDAQAAIAVLVRVRDNPAVHQEALRKSIAELDPGLALMSLGTLEDAVAFSAGFWPRTAAAGALAVALLAVGLASLGLYSTVSYFVDRRRREIGIYIALGASPADVFRQVVKQGSLAVAGGFAAGLPLSAAASFLISGLVYSVPAADPRVFAPACLFLALVAFTAMYLPARRATAVDPMVVLRQE